MPDHIDIVFDKQPGHDAPGFVEVEDKDRRSISFGEWVQRGDYFALRLTRDDFDAAYPPPPTDARQRVEAELLDLKGKTERLVAFMVSPKFEALDPVGRNLLAIQGNSMSAYATALTLRLAFWVD